MSGIIRQIVHLAAKIEEPTKQSNSNVKSKSSAPVIRVELDRRKILIQSREAVTTALILG